MSSAVCLGFRLYTVPWKLETAWSAVLQVENAGSLATKTKTKIKTNTNTNTKTNTNTNTNTNTKTN